MTMKPSLAAALVAKNIDIFGGKCRHRKSRPHGNQSLFHCLSERDFNGQARLGFRMGRESAEIRRKRDGKMRESGGVAKRVIVMPL